MEIFTGYRKCLIFHLIEIDNLRRDGSNFRLICNADSKVTVWTCIFFLPQKVDNPYPETVIAGRQRNICIICFYGTPVYQTPCFRFFVLLLKIKFKPENIIQLFPRQPLHKSNAFICFLEKIFFLFVPRLFYILRRVSSLLSK